MKLCIDYDGTYTEDPEFWDRVIELAKQRGHGVVCATMRYRRTEGAPVLKALDGKVDEVFFTDRAAKQPALNARGVFPDVWIDDSPHWLLNDAA